MRAISGDNDNRDNNYTKPGSSITATYHLNNQTLNRKAWRGKGRSWTGIPRSLSSSEQIQFGCSSAHTNTYRAVTKGRDKKKGQSMRCFWMPSFLEQKLAKKKKKSNNGKLFAGAFFGIWFQSFGLPQHVWAALIVNLNPAALWQTGTNWSSWVTERARFPRSKRRGQRLPKYPESPRGAEFIHSEVMRSTPTGSCNPSAQRPATPRCAGEQKGKKETPAYLDWHIYLTFNRTLNTIRSARPQQQQRLWKHELKALLFQTRVYCRRIRFLWTWWIITEILYSA